MEPASEVVAPSKVAARTAAASEVAAPAVATAAPVPEPCCATASPAVIKSNSYAAAVSKPSVRPKLSAAASQLSADLGGYHRVGGRTVREPPLSSISSPCSYSYSSSRSTATCPWFGIVCLWPCAHRQDALQPPVPYRFPRLNLRRRGTLRASARSPSSALPPPSALSPRT